MRFFTKVSTMVQLVVVMGGVAACSNSPQTPVSATSMQHHEQVAGQYAVSSPVMGNDAVSMPKTNIPSASPDTPICSAALHERAQSDDALLPHAMQGGNTCLSNACYQPLTATYIADNGQITVCR